MVIYDDDDDFHLRYASNDFLNRMIFAMISSMSP